jgi:hypothetical protein
VRRFSYVAAVSASVLLSCSRRAAESFDNDFRAKTSLIGEEKFAPVVKVGIPAFVRANVRSGEVEVPLDTNLEFEFSAVLNPSSVRSDSVIVTREDTGAIVPGTLQVSGKILRFTPTRHFYFKKNANGVDETVYSGFQANTGYRAVLGKGIEGKDGASPDEGKYVSFRCVDLEYGFYWLGANGEYEKAKAAQSNSFFDPTAPTVIYVHGWQSGTSKYDMQRENPFVYTGTRYGSSNVLPLWKARGFNVGVFQWGQWADEEEVRDAEIKVLNPQSLHKAKDGGFSGMRYRLRDGKYKAMLSNRSVSDFFMDEYKKIMSSYSGPEIRLVGHSLGVQLAGRALSLLAREVDEGRLSAQALPSRLVILDGFWSQGQKDYLNDSSPAQVFNESLRGVLEHRNLAIEQYKSSLLGGVVGDANLGVRKLSMFSRIVPGFIPVSDSVAQHLYSYVWYVNSIGRNTEDVSDALGASLSTEVLLEKMNSKLTAQVHHYQTEGVDTPSLQDDRFEERAGISPK